MTRGPAPIVGMDAALRIAEARGLVMVFRHSVRNLADFVIVRNGTVIFVRFRRTLCPRGSPEEIGHELRDIVASLRRIPVGRELWTYSRYGKLRFFRVDETCLVELGEDGKILPPQPAKPVKAAVRETPENPDKEPAPKSTGVSE